jgi:hypothetical protein
MADLAADRDAQERSSCWCCGGEFEETGLTRLGSHPEVAVCARCARWLGRRARANAESGSNAPGAWTRRRLQAVREFVLDHRIQGWPVVGSVLRRLDRHLP